MVSVSAPDARVASLLAAGQVPQVDVRATVLLRGGGAVAVPVSAASRRSSAAYIHRHELAVTVPDLSSVEARDVAQRREWDALDFGAGHSLRVVARVKAGSSWVAAARPARVTSIRSSVSCVTGRALRRDQATWMTV